MSGLRGFFSTAGIILIVLLTVKMLSFAVIVALTALVVALALVGVVAVACAFFVAARYEVVRHFMH